MDQQKVAFQGRVIGGWRKQLDACSPGGVRRGED